MSATSKANNTIVSDFRNVTEAICVLRAGRKDKRWYSAAEFLIARATPEVTLMLDVGRELGRKSVQEQRAEMRKEIPWKWGVIITVLGVVAIFSGYVLANLIGGICAH